jgi:hypothetical protein
MTYREKNSRVACGRMAKLLGHRMAVNSRKIFRRRFLPLRWAL